MASKLFAPWIADLQRAAGYDFSLVFLWLPSPDMAVARVASRVTAGGHGVAEDVVRRRYETGLRNFIRLYLPLADRWRVYNGSTAPRPTLVASGARGRCARVYDAQAWQAIRETAADAGA